MPPNLEGRVSGDIQFQGSLLANEVKASGQARLIRWIDETLPAITFQQPSKTFLNSGDFDVSVAISDPEAGLDPESIFLFLDDVLTTSTITPGDPFLHNTIISTNLTGIPEGIHQLRVEVRDRAGNIEQALKEVTVDLTPPTITSTVGPTPNAAGWHNVDVTVTFDCADDLSGIDSCTEPVTVETEGADKIVTGTAVDLAGNEANISITLNIDKTPHILSPIINPLPNASGWNNTDVTVSFDATDSLSGIADAPSRSSSPQKGQIK